MSETDSPADQPSLMSLLAALLRPRRSASEARRRIRRRIEEVRAVAREVEELMTALPEPAPEDLQAMVNGKLPWTPEAHMLALLREIRSRLEISDLPLLAVLDADDVARPEELSAAGFDAVLVKPFPFGEIEKYLVA